MKKAILIILGLFLLNSCSSDDDICLSSEGTPRLKLKFKDKNNKLIQLPRLFIDVDYGNGEKNVINRTDVDSVTVPLNIDNGQRTALKIYTAEKGEKATVLLDYTEQSEYVSPACGIRKLYKDVKVSLQKSNPVTSVEQVQTEVINENKTHLYLIF